MSYRNKRVIVTGGLGFIGSNLALRLVEEGAHVTVIDPIVPGCGGSLSNLNGCAGSIDLIQTSIADPVRVPQALRACDLVFNLAGEISHIHSMELPERDLQINTLDQLRFLLLVQDHAPGTRVVYAGTRQVYGVPDYLPVNEEHRINPVDFNGVHKYAATMYHAMLSNAGVLDGVVLRLTNVYGPRMSLSEPCQGFLSNFFRKALTGQTIEIFGDGLQLRDPVYVDDVVEAMLACGVRPHLASRSYNVGGPQPLGLGEIARTISQIAGNPEPRFREFPPERKAIDIGSYNTDSTRIRTEFGWRPGVLFAEGAARTLEFYRTHLSNYLDPSEPNPACRIRPAIRVLAPTAKAGVE